MIDYRAARVVAAVLQTGSFEAAARSLHVSSSAISQRVRQLEEALGVSLIQRGAPCTPTEAGQHILQHVQRLTLLEAELARNLPGRAVVEEDVPIAISIAANADSVATWFLEAIAPYLRQSGWLINVVIEDEDHTSDLLKNGKVWAAVTSNGDPVQGCSVKTLGELEFTAMCSPTFFEEHFSSGVTLETLAASPSVFFNQKDRLQERWVTSVLGRQISFRAHWLPSPEGILNATRLGIAWGMNPTSLALPLLKSGELVPLIPDTPLMIGLYWQISRSAKDQLSDLTRAVVRGAREHLVVPTTSPTPLTMHLQSDRTDQQRQNGFEH